MSGTYRAEWHARWRHLIDTLRNCRVDGTCAYCEAEAERFRAWVQGEEEAATSPVAEKASP